MINESMMSKDINSDLTSEDINRCDSYVMAKLKDAEEHFLYIVKNPFSNKDSNTSSFEDKELFKNRVNEVMRKLSNEN